MKETRLSRSLGVTFDHQIILLQGRKLVSSKKNKGSATLTTFGFELQKDLKIPESHI
jgi:hypothetical protein